MKTTLKKLALAIVIVSTLFSLGCSGTPITFRTTPSKPVDLKAGRPIAAKACGFQLLLFIPIAVNGRQERAYQSLMGQAGGDFISDVKVQESWTYGFVGTVYCTRLEAMAYPKLVKTE